MIIERINLIEQIVDTIVLIEAVVITLPICYTIGKKLKRLKEDIDD